MIMHDHTYLSHTHIHTHTCVASRALHMEVATSGDLAKAARVLKMAALRARGSWGHPTRPKREATGSHVWLSYITTRAPSS